MIRGFLTREGRSLSPETLLFQMYTLMVGLAFGFGAVVLLGPSKRFSGPSFQGPRDLFRWSGSDPRIIWGLLFVGLAVALVWGIGKQAAVHILRFGLVVHAFLAITFLASTFTEPAAALTGVVAYTAFAGIHLVLSVHLRELGWN